MRFHIVAFFALSALAVVALTRTSKTLAADQQTKRIPVIVELFTSEGCSSCPPADALLRKLEAEQPVANAEIIVLGEHVDYWNYIGWTDRFSSKQFTERQQQYANAFNLDSAYTPQMVVDGGKELNGADASSARRAIAEAAARPRLNVMVTESEGPPAAAKLRVEIGASPLAKKADVFVAVTESNLESQVKKGENGGRKLVHTGVVRSLNKIGELTGAAFQAAPALPLDPSWKRSDLHVIVFVQEKNNRHIIGASSLRLLH